MNNIKELYLKYKEIINYLIFGVLTTVVSLATYYICVYTHAYKCILFCKNEKFPHALF